MNKLSWLLYLADIAGSLAEIAGTFLFTLAVLATITFFIVMMLVHDSHIPYENIRKFLPLKTVKALLVMSLLVVAFVPEKTTIYLIAASELSEAAIKTETAQKIGDYLDLALESFEETINQ